MSIRRIAICLTMFIAFAAQLSKAQAQREIHHVPPIIDSDGYNPDLLHPFIEPLAFDPDWQFFAPAEVGEFGGGPDLNTGWFSSYARLYMWVSRPEDQAAITQFTLSNVPTTLGSPVDGDYGWGTRYEVGYMTDEDHGWLGSLWRIGGPHVSDVLQMERVNVAKLTDEQNTNFDPTSFVDLRGGTTAGGGGGGGGQQTAVRQFRQGIPAVDANNPQSGQRDYLVTNSINDMKLSSFELNKTFRWKKMTHGSTLEPFFGFRYMRFDNYLTRQQYNRWDPATGLSQPGLFPPDLDPEPFTVETLNSTKATFYNHMVGGQFGFRWYKRKSRWNLSSELRAFAFQNIQIFNSTTNVEVTYYEDFGIDEDVQSVTRDRQNTTGNGTEFVFGGEIRADAAFEITRDVSIQLGFNFMEIARGIGRGRTLQANDEDVTIFGFNGGFIVNR
ncbi:MAG TPA: hypothetical protein QF564_18470 [Pirellulaceae bacterium]|nr:hypothetical protein [Pirellulaceae bacterium]